MLIIPPNERDLICLVGIDPGTTFLGFGVLYFDPVTLRLAHASSELLRGEKLALDPWYISTHGPRASRVQAMRDRLCALFQMLRPLAVSAEGNFMNPHRPQAYGALVESVACIHQALQAVNYYQPLYMFEPSVVKKAVGAGGAADKEGVNKALHTLGLDQIYRAHISLQCASEHETDALAIAYTKYLEIYTAANDLYARFPQLMKVSNV